MGSTVGTIDVFALLLTVAQIAVAFAGFGAVATSLRKSAQHTQVNAGRVANMLITSLVAALLALTPCGLSLFEVPGAWTWRGASVLALLIFLIPSPGFAKNIKQMANRKGVHFPTLIINYGLVVFSVVVFGFCAFAVPLANPAALFILGLFSLMVVCGVLFFRVVYSVLISVVSD